MAPTVERQSELSAEPHAFGHKARIKWNRVNTGIGFTPILFLFDTDSLSPRLKQTEFSPIAPVFAFVAFV